LKKRESITKSMTENGKKEEREERTVPYKGYREKYRKYERHAQEKNGSRR
jgi:hypothetical protein